MKYIDVNLEKVIEVKTAFNEAGISVSEWARTNGFSGSLVYQVLDGKRLCKRGQSHKIAVALGLKEGRIASIQDFSDTLGKSI